MTDPAGGFYSTQDADSEGEEGKFFVWTAEEVDALARRPKTPEIFCAYFDVTGDGNFEHRNILHVTSPLHDVAARARGLTPSGCTRQSFAVAASFSRPREQRIQTGSR